MTMKQLLGIIYQNKDYFQVHLLDEKGNVVLDKNNLPKKININNTDNEFTKNKELEYLNIRITRTNIQSTEKQQHFITLEKLYDKLSNVDENFNKLISQPIIFNIEKDNFNNCESSVSFDFKFNPNNKNENYNRFLKFFTLPSTWAVLTFLEDKEMHYKRIPKEYLNEHKTLQDENYQSKGHIARKIKISTRSVHDDLLFLTELGLIESIYIGSNNMRFIKSNFEAINLETIFKEKRNELEKKRKENNLKKNEEDSFFILEKGFSLNNYF